MINEEGGVIFPCPACRGNCYAKETTPAGFIVTVVCGECNNSWLPVYVKGFWAGYAKKEKEING